jgi:hypothetical protein
MKVSDNEQFFKVFIFSDSFSFVRQFASFNYSIEISSHYDEAIEFIMQPHKRRQFDFILIDVKNSDLFDCIRLLSFVRKNFPEIKRVIVIDRSPFIDDETLIKTTFDADSILNLDTTGDFFNFFKTAFSDKA